MEYPEPRGRPYVKVYVPVSENLTISWNRISQVHLGGSILLYDNQLIKAILAIIHELLGMPLAV